MKPDSPAAAAPVDRLQRRYGRRRRVAAGVLSALLALSAAAGLAQGLSSCRSTGRAEAARPLSAAEADRLAGMRLRNHRDGRVGVRATIGRQGRQLRLAGWVDWRRDLAYLSVAAPAAWRGTGAPTDPFRPGEPAGGGPVAGLVQAVPGVIAVRDGLAGAAAGDVPPLAPPGDGWAVRRATLAAPAGAPVDAFVALLFTIAHAAPDGARALASSDARWLRRDRIGGVGVDVLLGPAVPPAAPTPADGSAAPTSLARMGGAVRYWLDDTSRVLRLEALLARDLPVRVDLAREDRRRPTAIAALGGPTNAPRAVNRAEARALARLRQRNRAAGGGRLSLTLPAEGGTVRGAGWVDWRDTVAHLTLRGPGHPGPGTELVADRGGVATRRARPGREPVTGPPVGAGWRTDPWAARGDRHGAYDLELMLNELLALAADGPDPTRTLRTTASRLRADRLRGRAVTVYEVPKRPERGLPRGRARLRYWVAADGVLRRLELRTREGAFAQLDVRPGRRPGPLSAAAAG